MLSVGDFVARYTYKYSRSFLTSEAIINIILNIKSFFVEYHIESMLVGVFAVLGTCLQIMYIVSSNRNIFIALSICNWF